MSKRKLDLSKGARAKKKKKKRKVVVGSSRDQSGQVPLEAFYPNLTEEEEVALYAYHDFDEEGLERPRLGLDELVELKQEIERSTGGRIVLGTTPEEIVASSERSPWDGVKRTAIPESTEPAVLPGGDSMAGTIVLHQLVTSIKVKDVFEEQEDERDHDERHGSSVQGDFAIDTSTLRSMREDQAGFPETEKDIFRTGVGEEAIKQSWEIFHEADARDVQLDRLIYTHLYSAPTTIRDPMHYVTGEDRSLLKILLEGNGLQEQLAPLVHFTDYAFSGRYDVTLSEANIGIIKKTWEAWEKEIFLWGLKISEVSKQARRVMTMVLANGTELSGATMTAIIADTVDSVFCLHIMFSFDESVSSVSNHQLSTFMGYYYMVEDPKDSIE